MWILPQLLSELRFDFLRQAEVFSPRVKGTDFDKWIVELASQRLAPVNWIAAEG